jgi:hypothetical protein
MASQSPEKNYARTTSEHQPTIRSQSKPCYPHPRVTELTGINPKVRVADHPESIREDAPEFRDQIGLPAT